MDKSWIYVALTSLFELFWMFALNVASSWWHWAIMLVVAVVDFYFLKKACENLPTGTVYVVYAAVGTVGTALMDVYIFGGSFSVAKMLFILLLIGGVIGLRLADRADEVHAEKEAY